MTDINKLLNKDTKNMISYIDNILNNMSDYIANKRGFSYRFENNNIPILNLFKNEKEFLLLESYIEIFYGIKELFKFKESFTNLVINDIEKRVNNKYFIFDYYEINDFIGIVVKMKLKDLSYTDIGIIDVFKKKFIILDNELELKINERINELNNEIEILNKNEVDLSIASKNPTILANGNPLKLLDISARKSKYIKKIKEDIKKNDFERIECFQKISDYKAKLEEINLFLLELKNFQHNLAKELKSLYNIELLEKEVEVDSSFDVNDNKKEEYEIKYF